MQRQQQRGFSLIEMMVGLVVSMICVLAIMAAFAVYEGKKRTTTTGNDAQQNGSYAMYLLERQLRTGGSGVVQGENWGLWGCPVNATINGAAVLPSSGLVAPFTAWPSIQRMVPVLISSGGTGADVIGLVEGDSSQQNFAVTVNATGSATTATVANAQGILTGDYLIGVLPSGTCPMVHIASTSPTAQVSSNTLSFETANSVSTGLLGATLLFDLGPAPGFTLFGVDSTNHLEQFDLLQRKINGQPAAPMPIADGVVMMKALYGVHTNSADSSADTIDSWVAPTGNYSIATLTASTSAAQTAASQIKAIRVAIVVQSRLPESSTDYPNAPSTLTLFKDQPTASQFTFNISTAYRYKVYDTVIPVRNALINDFY